MSKFSWLWSDIHLWEASTTAKWDLLDLCPAVMWFQVWAIMPAQWSLKRKSLRSLLLKESKHVRVARQDYYKTHQPNYEHEGSYNLSSTFRDMATSANLMGSEIHEVWISQKDLRVTHHVAKTSPKDICLFRVMMPSELPKIMGLRGIHSPKALQRWVDYSFVCGVEKDRMRVWWWTTYELAITTWDSFTVTEWNTLPWVPCASSPSCVSCHWLA